MDLGLQGLGTIVTGGSRGIGRAITLHFAREGANVAICARGEEALRAAREEIATMGVKVHAAACDVADAAALSEFLDSARAALGRIDVLVNNPSGFGMDDDEAGWAASFGVDVMASVRAAWIVVPWMVEQSGGAVIHISSTSGMEAGSSPPYAAAKAALISHSKTLAAVLAPRGIRVNCVAPGSIEFPGGFWDRIKHENRPFYDSVRARIPFGRLGTPEEVAAAVVFLASPRASWISGVTLPVDGVQHKGNL